MTRLFKRQQKTLMSKKFFSMLLGGTLAMMMASVLLMSDSIVAAAIIGSEAVAGITLVTPIYSVATFFSAFFSMGVPLVYNAEMGKYNKTEADRAFGTGLLACLVVGVVLFVLVTAFGDAYLRSSDPPAHILAEARGYLFWLRFAILIMPVQTLMSAVVYCDGDEALTTLATAVQCLGNIAASVLLCRRIGIRGIGLASFLFFVISLGIMLIHFFKKSNSIRWNLYFSAKLLSRVMRFSMIDASAHLFLGLMTAALNAFVSARFGADCLILVSAMVLCQELQIMFDGIGGATTPILSIYLGEECHSGVRSIYRLANKTAVIEGIVITVALFICAPLVPRILDITDPEMARCAAAGIRILSLGSVFVSLLYLLSSYYLVSEKISLGVAVCALRDLLPAVPLAIALGWFFGLGGIFIGLAAAPAIGWGLLMLWLIRRYGRADCPLLLSTLPCTAKSYLYDLSVEPEQVVDLQSKVRALLRENGVDGRTTNRVELLIEEIFMLIHEMNGGRVILGECAILLRSDSVQLITRDDGEIFDIADENMNVTSLSAFVLASYMEKLVQDRRHLTTLSFNRSSFLIKAGEKLS